MPYKISGTKSETARIITVKESDWSVEDNTVISGSGSYEITGLEVGTKTVVARSAEGEMLGFGNVTSEFYAPPGLEIWMWGRNDYGELGQEDITARSSPVQVGALTAWENIACGEFHTMTTKTDKTLWSWGYNGSGQLGLGNQTNYSSPVQVGSLTDWSSITGGQYHVSALK